MQQAYKFIRKAIKNPFLLESIKDSHMNKILDSYFPYSVGIEVEATFVDEDELRLKLSKSKLIACLIGYNIREHESAFRLPAGKLGLIGLYELSKFLNENYCFNRDSGIHYHIDMTKSQLFQNRLYQLGIRRGEEIKENIRDYVLSELSTWKYKGKYNRKRVCFFEKDHVWVNFRHSFSTMEIRIGEMTFDYNVLLKRIQHGQKIVRHINNKLLENL